MVWIDIPLAEVTGSLDIQLCSLCNVHHSLVCTVRCRCSLLAIYLDVNEWATLECLCVESYCTTSHDVERNALRTVQNDLCSVPAESQFSSLAVNCRCGDERLEILRNRSCISIFEILSFHRRHGPAPVTAGNGKIVELWTVYRNIDCVISHAEVCVHSGENDCCDSVNKIFFIRHLDSSCISTFCLGPQLDFLHCIKINVPIQLRIYD